MQLATTTLLKGLVYEKEGKPEEGAKQFQRAKSINPTVFSEENLKKFKIDKSSVNRIKLQMERIE